ncbi:segregation and condensation protein B [Pseudomonas psychrotolerans L19]|uniref:SMC-Scp complex subunit ScpB n=1 Tax=Pseudomonas oryzihabitans TaxID=47885 RepID=UPI00023A5564|nr:MULTISPECIES: SMC-Scp complex subunit ScpB [Pseudomonas]EHK72876.1 segregation and condensation protein B [Pseudomonas psychrotolerans L19]MBA1181589.1 SMC-Scp complex subunit ScpB [Pseudomonas psychrotolerans]MBA1213137.1 SMC-Scp complex subunit ScpB [Pseudomonas psychrotolerans]
MNYTDPKQLAPLLEAILLAAGRPLTLERLAELFEEYERPEPAHLRAGLAVLGGSCRKRGFELKEVASGYRLQVREKYAPWVGRLWEERPPRYSRAMLETLALIAYRQPITRGEIEEVRGVAVNSQIVKTLLERDWIRVVGYRDVPGRPAMFATTKTFLDYFDLRSLDQLPPLAEVRQLEPEPASVLEDPELSLAALGVGDAEEAEEGTLVLPERTSFRTLLTELDAMETGLKTDFDDLQQAADEEEEV